MRASSNDYIRPQDVRTSEEATDLKTHANQHSLLHFSIFHGAGLASLLIAVPLSTLCCEKYRADRIPSFDAIPVMLRTNV